MVFRPARAPLLLALLFAVAVVGYLATHRTVWAPLAARLAGRHLLRDVEGGIRFRDLRWRFPGGLDLYGVSLTLQQGEGGVLVVVADTLNLDFEPEALARTPLRLQRARVAGGQLFLRQAEPKPRRDAKPSALPSRWPQLAIDRLEIVDARVEVSDADGRLRDRLPRVALAGSVAADSTLRLDVRRLDAWWESRGTRLEQLSGRLEAGAGGLRVSEARGLLNGRTAALDGRFLPGGDLDLEIAGEGADAAEIDALLHLGLGLAAHGDLHASISTRGDTLRLGGEFSGVMEGHRLEGARARGVLLGTELAWSELEGRVDGVLFRGRGEFDLADPEAVGFRLEGEAEDLDISGGIVPQEELPPTGGHGQVAVRHDGPAGRTSVTATLADGSLDAVPFDACRIELTASEEEVVFHRLDLELGVQRASVQGTLDRKRRFDGQLSLELPSLQDLPEGWRLGPLTGAAGAEGRLRGPLDELRFEGRLTWRELGCGPLATAAGEANVEVEGLPEDPRASFQVRGLGLRVGELPLGDYRFAGSASTRKAAVQGFQTSRGDTVLTMSLAADFADGGASVAIDRFAVELEGMRWELAEQAKLEARAGSVSLPKLQLTSAQGSLVVGGSYEPDRRLELGAQLERFDLQLLDLILGGEGRLRGIATATLLVQGEPRRPEADLTATIVGADLPTAHLDSLSLTAHLSGGRLELRDLTAATPHGRVRAKGMITNPGVRAGAFWRGAGLDLQVSLRDGDWAWMEQFHLPALDRLSGRFAADLRVGGRTDAPIVAGRVRSEPFNIHWLHLETLEGEVAADRTHLALTRLQARQGALTASGRLELPLDFDLLGALDTPADGPFLLEVELPPGSDLTPLARATNGFIETSGVIEGKVTIAGPMDHPLWDGRFELREGGFVLKGLGEIYHGIAAGGVFAGDVLTVDPVAGLEGERGRFRGRGKLVFRGLELETFSLRANLDRVLVASIPELRALVQSDDFELTGVKVGPDSLLVPRFAGRIELIQGRYTGDFAERPTVNDPRLATVSPDWLADLRIFAPPRSLRILNRAMELSVSGDVNLRRDEAGLSLRGSLDIDAGRLPVFNNDFKVVRGTVDFSRGVGFDPQVEMEAETRVRVRDPDHGGSLMERVTVTVAGRLYEPSVSFSSESGYSRQGIERMLMGLSPYAGDPGTEGGLREASIAAGFNLLEREIAAGLDLVDTFDIEQTQRRHEDGTVGLVPLIGVGKYLGQDLYIKYAQGLSQQPDRDLLIEYQITDHLLLQSEVRRRLEELQGETTYSLDFKYRFEY